MTPLAANAAIIKRTNRPKFIHGKSKEQISLHHRILSQIIGSSNSGPKIKPKVRNASTACQSLVRVDLLPTNRMNGDSDPTAAYRATSLSNVMLSENNEEVSGYENFGQTETSERKIKYKRKILSERVHKNDNVTATKNMIQRPNSSLDFNLRLQNQGYQQLVLPHELTNHRKRQQRSKRSYRKHQELHMFSNSVPYMPPFGNVTTTAQSTARDHERGISGLSFVTAPQQHAAILLQP